MLYFAYGSNMDWQRMKERCPSARFVCIALLESFNFDFKWKCRDGHGVMNVVEDPTSEVWGVVYQIDELDIGRLDYKEGYRPGRPMEKNSYKRIEAMVYDGGDRKKPLTVWTYRVVKPLAEEEMTIQAYKDHFVNGAHYWHLPPKYIERLEAVPVKDQVANN
jgi:gamma-glutamylcyclotransferase